MSTARQSNILIIQWLYHWSHYRRRVMNDIDITYTDHLNDVQKGHLKIIRTAFKCLSEGQQISNSSNTLEYKSLIALNALNQTVHTDILS
jgi:hypothetical protein